jgi:hypothetical protein
MDSGRVVFAAKLGRNFREAHMEFAPQQVHGDLPGNNNMFVALGTQDVGGVNLEMLGDFIDNLFDGQVVRPCCSDVRALEC